MKLRHPALVGLAALVLSVIIRVWMRCVRVRFANFDADDHYTDPRQKPLVYTFWHENILFASTEPVRCRVLISQHADGELIARTAHHLKKDNVRGSSTRGGTAAVFEMLRNCATHHIAVTPDGPQGPRRRVQMGVVFLASQSGRPVVPLGVGYSHAWRAKSWDRFAVALPGSVACLVAAPAVAVPKKLSRADLEVYRRRIEASLHWADDAAQTWATTGQRPTRADSPERRRRAS